ncbi:hypothetical protein [Streptomyces antibioticus]|uniref:hypothetical protein n=1 Tax=Streptomyces antibioticus TaxID=1890 RepID=UPI0036FA8374
MTTQPTIDPGEEYDLLCQLGAELLRHPEHAAHPDLWGQGITPPQIHAMTDIPLTGRYL